MKRLIKSICFALVFATILAVPVSANEAAPYASNYFGSHSTYLTDNTSSSFKVVFSITAVRTMSELGVNYIDIERSSDGINWSVVKTYDHDDYGSLIAYNTYYHSGTVTYSNKTSGYQYRAYVDYHAKNSSGSASYGVYAYF